MVNQFILFIREESAVTMVEYALIIAMLSLAVTVALLFLQSEIEGLFKDIASCVEGVECERDGS